MRSEGPPRRTRGSRAFALVSEGAIDAPVRIEGYPAVEIDLVLQMSSVKVEMAALPQAEVEASHDFSRIVFNIADRGTLIDPISHGEKTGIVQVEPRTAPFQVGLVTPVSTVVLTEIEGPTPPVQARGQRIHLEVVRVGSLKIMHRILLAGDPSLRAIR